MAVGYFVNQTHGDNYTESLQHQVTQGQGAE